MDKGTVLPRTRQATAWRALWHALIVVGVATAVVIQFTRPSYELLVGDLHRRRGGGRAGRLAVRPHALRPSGACRAR